VRLVVLISRELLKQQRLDFESLCETEVTLKVLLAAVLLSDQSAIHFLLHIDLMHATGPC